VTEKEAKRILENSPPNRDFLFGGKVKEQVQQIRDSLQIKKVFQRPSQLNGFGYGQRRQGMRGAPYPKVRELSLSFFGNRM
jgi:hypothetical protein